MFIQRDWLAVEEFQKIKIQKIAEKNKKNTKTQIKTKWK
jgi:hypothetical protein